jgi:ParB-like chromosome segregation protein Spo0J
MKIENIKTESLVPYARNAKLHDENQVSKIASSIREFGFNNPVLVDGEKPPGIIAGHGRVLAAKKLGLAEVPCIRLAHLSEAQKRAYILADNRLAELGGGWDSEMLKLELADLGELDFDLETIGFGEDDLGDLDIDLGDGAGAEGEGAGDQAKLSDRFGYPPFSVLNAREGWWQDRKRAWLALGIKSELGRGEQLIPNGGGMSSKERYSEGATLGAIAPNEKSILKRTGKYAGGGHAAPGGSLMPAANYSKTKARGTGTGKAIL